MTLKECFIGVFVFLFTIAIIQAQNPENIVRTDSISSFINFSNNAKELHGEISGISTNIVIDKENLKASFIKCVATVRSINTGNLVRDKKIIGKKYLNEKEFPVITFESTKIDKMEENVYMVAGDLTIRDITEQIFIEFYFQIDRVLGVSYFNTDDFDLAIKDNDNSKVDLYFELFHPGAE